MHNFKVISQILGTEVFVLCACNRLAIKRDFSLPGGLHERQAADFSAHRPITYNSSTRKSLPRALFKVVDSMI